MELLTHSLLALVESNRNGLKSMLTHYIDATVDSHYNAMKLNIFEMIQSGQIFTQQNDDVSAFGTTSPPPTQANTDQSSAQCSHEYSNDTLTRAQQHQNNLQNEVALANTITTDELMIKQELDDEDGEEIDYETVLKCENCEKEICNSVRENYDDTSGNTDTSQTGDKPLESQQNVDAALKNHQMNQSIISNDILPNPNNPINTVLMIKQECLESLSITTHSNNAASKNISIDEPIEGQNAPIPTDEFDDKNDANDDYYEDSENGHLNQPNYDDSANGVCDLGHLNNNGSFETQHVDAALEDNQINQSIIISNHINETTENANNGLQVNDESDQLHNVRRPNDQDTRQMNTTNKSATRQAARPVSDSIESSTPSTSGVQSSTRKRIQKKVVGDDQSNAGDKRAKSEKRKSVQSNNKSVRKSKRLKIENAHENIDDQEKVKGQVVVIELHCTEPGCGQTVTSRSSWREHMRDDHHKLPHYQLTNNVRFNDRDQTEHPCLDPTCNVICTSHRSSIKHWNYHHQPGKFKCPSCRFVASLYYKVWNHLNTTHGSHGCIHDGCGEKFPTMSELKRHKRVHTDERPYKCTWKKCQSSFKQIGTAFGHVRVMHFNLPKSTKEQNELNIIDSRNAHDYIHKD